MANLAYGTQGDGLGASQQAYIDKLMTSRLAQQMVFDRYATIQKALPQNNGKDIKFRKWVPMRDLMLANSIYTGYTGNTPTTNGEEIAQLVPYSPDPATAVAQTYSDYVLPEGSSGTEAGSMKVVELNSSVFPIGMWMTVNEEVNLFHDMYTVAENVTQYSEVASVLIDGFYRDTYINGAGHIQDITGGTAPANNVTDTAFTGATKKISLQLRLSNAKYISSVLSSSPNYATEPIWSRYVGIVNPMMGEAMKANADFKPLETYSAGVKPLEGEIGMIGDIRVIENANMLIETTGTAGEYTGYMLVMAKDHTANIPLRGKKRVEVIVKGLDTKDKSDPLNRTQIIGWKSWLGAYTVSPEKLGLVKAVFDI